MDENDSTEDSELDLFDPFPDGMVIEIKDIFDLHSIPAKDVRRIVEEYLKEAHRKGFRSVRLIHGRGKGVQRKIVRSILRRTSFVAGWTDAPPEAGGSGATVVHFFAREGNE